MNRIFFIFLLVSCFIIPATLSSADDYTVGIGDILQISILQPDRSTNDATVSPGGNITVPYLGNIKVKGLTIAQIRYTIESKLSNGYFKTPVVSVSLIESRSRTFTITGAVNTPGSYPLGENTTVLKAITLAGWFTRFASKNKVRLLRPRRDRPGYNHIEINIEAILQGKSNNDVVLQSGDIVVVPE